MLAALILAQAIARAPTSAATTHWPHSTNLYPTHLDVRFGTGPNEVLDILANDIRDPGGCGVVVMLHAGAGVELDHKDPWCSGTGGENALAWYLTENKLFDHAEHFDIVSVNYEQWAWRVPSAVTHIPPWHAIDNPTDFFGQVASVEAALGWIFANAGVYGWDTSKLHVMGGSQGAVIAMKVMFNGAHPVASFVVEGSIPDYRDPKIHVIVGEGMYGDATQSAWLARSRLEKEALSALPYFEAGDLANVRPLYVLNALVGDGVTPYGDPGHFGSNVHDHAQYVALTGALQSAAIPASQYAFEDYPRLAWELPASGHLISARVEAFLLAHQ